MTEKEKARAYDEALKKARQLCDYPTTKPFISDLQDLFPELKESKDERIRKVIIGLLKQSTYEDCDYDGVNMKDIYAWLENKVELKNNNKLIWKHWSGCGIAGNGDGTQIYLIKQYNTYSVCSCLSYECDYILLSDLDKLISDGDSDVRYRYLDDILIEHIEHGKYYYCIKDYYAGGNKRASKGDVVKALNGMNMMALGVEANEYFIPVKSIVDISRTAWSEDDEVKINRIVACLENLNVADNDILLKDVEWLKSLKNRVQTQPKQEWSEEDEHRINHISDFIWKNRKGDTDDIYQQEQDVNWLKSFIPQKQWKPSNTQMQALKEACDIYWEPDGSDALYTLYEQLKKLTE